MGEEYSNLAVTTAESLRLFSQSIEDSPLESPFGIPFGIGVMNLEDLDVKAETKRVLEAANRIMESCTDFIEDKKVANLNDFSYSSLEDENCINIDIDDKQMPELSDIVDSDKIRVDIINRFWTKSKVGKGSFSSARDMHEIIITQCPKTLNKYHSFGSNMIGGRLELLLESMFKNRESTLVEAEKKAQERLLELLDEKQRISFMVNDCFYEHSTKSGASYVFRRNRPTLALRLSDPVDGRQEVKFLASLCCHPMGYYTNTFAGVMTPSDELIANLLLLRADEHGFWKRSNQHPIHDPRSGV